MINSLTNEPMKVNNWNNPHENETRIDYCLSIIEGGKWEQIGTEIDQEGNVRTVIKQICDMP